jgi:hypothetical protein
MHDTHAASDSLYALGPFLQAVTGIISERRGDVVRRGRHCNGWGDGWVGGGMDGC